MSVSRSFLRLQESSRPKDNWTFHVVWLPGLETGWCSGYRWGGVDRETREK